MPHVRLEALEMVSRQSYYQHTYQSLVTMPFKSGSLRLLRCWGRLFLQSQLASSRLVISCAFSYLSARP